jgi:hypothetical protein
MPSDLQTCLFPQISIKVIPHDLIGWAVIFSSYIVEPSILGIMDRYKVLGKIKAVGVTVYVF